MCRKAKAPDANVRQAVSGRLIGLELPYLFKVAPSRRCAALSEQPQALAWPAAGVLARRASATARHRRDLDPAVVKATT